MAQHSRLNPRLKPVPAALLLVLLIVPVLVYAATQGRRYAQSRYAHHAGVAAEEFAKLMKKRADEERVSYSRQMEITEIVGGQSWGCCGYDLGDIAVEIVGEAPAYEGTVIRVKAHKLDDSGLLTVKDLSNASWSVEYPEVPEWWEIWK